MARASRRSSISTCVANLSSFASLEHERLLQTVHGVLDRTLPVGKAAEHINHLRELNDAGARVVAPEAVVSAVEILRECLRTRLREGSVSCILNGEKRIQKDEIDSIATDIANVRSSRVLDDLNLQPFERLERNYQIRWSAKNEGSEDSVMHAKRLGGFLARRARPNQAEKHAMLTDLTVEQVCSALLRAMTLEHIEPMKRTNELLSAVEVEEREKQHYRKKLAAEERRRKVCEAVMKQRIVDVLRRLALGFPEYHIKACCVENPELQMRLMQILAEIVILTSEEDFREKTKQKMGALLGGKTSKFSMISDVKGGYEYSAEGAKAMELLLEVLAERLDCNQHAAVWGCIQALQRIAEHPTASRRIILSEGVPIIMRASAHYRSVRELPPTVERERPREPVVTLDAPDFLGANFLPAMDRKPPGVMERFRATQSMTDLRGKERRKSTLFDEGVPVKPGAKPVNPKLESLAYLLCEEDEYDRAYYRSTDRNLMVLQLHRLLRTVEASRASKELKKGWKIGGKT